MVACTRLWQFVRGCKVRQRESMDRQFSINFFAILASNVLFWLLDKSYTWYLSIHVLQSGFIQQSHIVFDQNKFPRRQRNFTEFRITEFPHRLYCSIHIEDKLDSLVNAPIWFLLDKNRIAVQAIPFLSDRNRIGAVMRAPIWFLSNRNGIDL